MSPVGAGMKPRFVDDMKNITVEVGQDATFTCTVSEIHVGRLELETKVLEDFTIKDKVI